MTGGHVGHTIQDTEGSVVSGITNEESTNSDNALSLEEKKRKIDSIFLSQQWTKEDEYVITKLRQVIRNHIFKHVKFVKGEGAIPAQKKR